MNATNIFILLASTLPFSLDESLLVPVYFVLLGIAFPAICFKDMLIAQASIPVFIITVLTYTLRQRIEDFEAMQGWILAALCPDLILIRPLTLFILFVFLYAFGCPGYADCRCSQYF